jgi:hypothetical protein
MQLKIGFGTGKKETAGADREKDLQGFNRANIQRPESCCRNHRQLNRKIGGQIHGVITES